MKRLLFLILVMFLSVFISGCDFWVDAVDYNNEMVSFEDQMLDVYNDYIDFIMVTNLTSEELDILDSKRLRVIKQLKDIKYDLIALDWYKWDVSFSEAVINRLEWMIDRISNDNVELINLWRKWVDLEWIPSSLELDLEQSILDRADMNDELFRQKVEEAQAVFSRKHGYEIEE